MPLDGHVFLRLQTFSLPPPHIILAFQVTLYFSPTTASRRTMESLLEKTRNNERYLKRLANSSVAGTVALYLLLIAGVILGGIALGHWWTTVGCCSSGATTATYTIIYRETTLRGTCPIAISPGLDNCFQNGAVQTVNGTLVLQSDTSVEIGVSWGYCITIFTEGDDGAPYRQLCTREFVFDGSGDITAGKIVVTGDYYVPANISDVSAFETSVWEVSGGTGSIYSRINGGQLTFTTAAEIAHFDGTLTFNTEA